jgi:signal transduction histidine kinase
MLLHLINDILDMSKLDSGQMQLTPVSYRTGDMLSDIVGMLWLRAKEKKLEFHVNVAPDIPAESGAVILELHCLPWEEETPKTEIFG